MTGQEEMLDVFDFRADILTLHIWNSKKAAAKKNGSLNIVALLSDSGKLARTHCSSLDLKLQHDITGNDFLELLLLDDR